MSSDDGSSGARNHLVITGRGYTEACLTVDAINADARDAGYDEYQTKYLAKLTQHILSAAATREDARQLKQRCAAATKRQEAQDEFDDACAKWATSIALVALGAVVTYLCMAAFT